MLLLLATLTLGILTSNLHAETESAEAKPPSTQRYYSTTHMHSRQTPSGAGNQRQRALAAQIQRQTDSTTQAVWLNTNQETDILALHESAQGHTEKGAMVIVHDKNQHPDWPGVIREMRLQLPLHGWQTLSVELLGDRQHHPRTPPAASDTTQIPSADTNTPEVEADSANPDITDTSGGAAQPSSAKVKANTHQRNQQRILSALNWSKQNAKGLTLMLVIGQNAKLSLEALQQSDALPDLVIMLNATDTLPASDPASLVQLSETAKWFTLDIVSGLSYDAPGTKLREKRLNQSDNKRYQRRNYPRLYLDDSINVHLLVKNVRGWLDQSEKNAAFAPSWSFMTQADNSAINYVQITLNKPA